MTDQEDTRPTPEIPAEAPTEEAPTRETKPRRFMRSSDDRVIGGVAGGLGRYFNVDPVILRIAFAVSVLFGGLGVIAYLAVWLFVPADDRTGAAVPHSRGRGIARVLGIAALAAIGVVAFGTLVAGAALVTGLGYGLAVAAAIVVIGIALAALSFRGNAKWLIVPAFALSIGVGVAAAADLDLEGGIGERDYRPASAAAIPTAGYELGVGRLAVDLRGIDWNPKRVVDLSVQVGAGQAVVAVPSDVCVVADARAGAGELVVAGQRADGFDVELATGEGSRSTPQVRLDADVDFGQIKVINDDSIEVADVDERFEPDRGNDSAARAANARACAA